MSSKGERVEDYEDWLPSELAERLADTEDELELWKSRAERAEIHLCKCVCHTTDDWQCGN